MPADTSTQPVPDDDETIIGPATPVEPVTDVDVSAGWSRSSTRS
jgi:hypothetical protein